MDSPLLTYGFLSAIRSILRLCLCFFGEIGCLHPTEVHPTGGTAAPQRARFQAVCAASSWFRQNSVVSSHPPVPLKGHNASRWAAKYGNLVEVKKHTVGSYNMIALALKEI